MVLMEVILNEPFIAVQLEFFRLLPNLAYAVVPRFQHFFELIKLRMSAPSFVNCKALHSLK